MASRKEQKEQLRAERLAREAAEQAQARRRRLVQYGAAAGLLAVIVVVVAIVVSQSGSSGSGAGSGGDVVDASLVSKQLKGIPQQDTVLGDPKSKVTVVEYGDLQCPVCQQFSFQVAPEIISKLVRKGTAAYEFRQWTIIGAPPHEQSVAAAKAALAAGEQGRYWNFIELFYRNQGPEDSGYVTDSFLESIAKAAGVPDIDKWHTDRKSPRWDAVLSSHDTQARGFGFTGTPSILVEGPGGRKTFTATIPTFSQIDAAVKAVQ